jgi:hypothetical protein
MAPFFSLVYTKLASIFVPAKLSKSNLETISKSVSPWEKNSVWSTFIKLERLFPAIFVSLVKTPLAIAFPKQTFSVESTHNKLEYLSRTSYSRQVNMKFANVCPWQVF